MTTRHTIELETLSLAFFAAIAGIIFAFYNHGPKARAVFNLPIVDALVTPTPTPLPTPNVDTFSQLSPNGLEKLTMLVTPHGTTSKTYLFTTTDGDGKNSQTIYSINLPVAENMSIPFNTFSPDNKYLFVQHNTSSGSEALVFRTSGEPMAENTPYYNAPEIFAARDTGNTYQETTGWASETLLIINTTVNGTKGPSYWLEVPSKAVIQLSTEF